MTGAPAAIGGLGPIRPGARTSEVYPMTLYDLAVVIRSKNAGPFTLTIDVLFASPGDMQRALASPGLTAAAVAAQYGVSPEQVSIHTLDPACAIKVTLPRRASSGSAADTDVYGSQQHLPLARIRV